MSVKFELKAEPRSELGKGASRRLRRAGKVPGILYGGETAPLAIELDHNQLLLALRKEAFHSSVVSLIIDGKKEQAVLRDTQVHAYKPLVLHVDFQRVDAKQTLHIKVPLHFVNEENAPGVKLSGGHVNHVLTELEIACLPKDLPEFIEVDIGELKVGQNLHVSQLKLPKGVKAVVHGDDGVVVAIVGKGGPSADEAAAETPAA